MLFMKCVLPLLAAVSVSCLSFLLLLCVDVLLVCAEGCTQVTGVVAMTMTGRVLLVCALCVLWCGGGGGYAEDVDVAVGCPGTFGEGGGGAGGQSSPADGSRGGSRGSKADGSHLGEIDASDSASDDISLAPSPALDVFPTLSEEPLPQEEEESERKQKHPKNRDSSCINAQSEWKRGN
ncbi:mucin-associated surface protein (MASP) [Trypanosoma cruzi]|nr:mucin-associated surface protein (MASP) [Trypanosoma cruzi]